MNAAIAALEPLGGGSVASEERLERLGMGEIEAAAAGEQELARRRGSGVVNDDATAGASERFGRRQTGRSGADDDGVDRRGPRSPCFSGLFRERYKSADRRCTTSFFTLH